MRQVKRLQQWQLEEVERDRGELVLGEIHVSETSNTHGLLVQETRQEQRQGNIAPHQVVCPGDLNVWPCVLNSQDSLLRTVVQCRVLPRGSDLIRVFQLHTLKSGHLQQRVLSWRVGGKGGGFT